MDENKIKNHERFCGKNPDRANKPKPKDARSAESLLMCQKEFAVSTEPQQQKPDADKAKVDIKKLLEDSVNEVLQSPSDPEGAFLKENPSTDTSIPKSKLPVPPSVDNHREEEKKEQKRTRLYYALVGIFVFAGALQYIILNWLQVHWIFLVILWIIDLIILAFLIYTVWRLRKKQEPVIFEDIEDFIEQVPKWAIEERSPKSGIIGSILNKGKDYKQLVFVSENFEPKTLWAEWDGFLFRIGNRAYKPPRDVRGDLFIYHVDKKMPLIDSAEATAEDAEDSYQLLAVWNQAFSVGHAAALNETQQQIKMILLIAAITLIVVIGLAIYQYGQFDEMHKQLIGISKGIEILQQAGTKP